MITIPNELRDFALWLNPGNLRAFNKLEVIQLGLKLVKTKSSKISPQVQSKLSEGLLDDDKSLGIFALRLYFYQIFHLHAFSLDLRRSHFCYANFWIYESEKLGYQFSQSFISGLKNTYKSYYLNQTQGMEESLEQLKLFAPTWNTDQKKALLNLFLEHFKAGADRPIYFKISDMLESFGNIFFYIKDNGGKVPSEFALLGIYLASLYLTLEATGQDYDVKEAFLFSTGLSPNNL